MKDYILEKVKNYILVYCLTDKPGKKFFEKENYNISITKYVFPPNFINPIYFEQYYFIFKGYIQGKNIITDGYFQCIDYELNFISSFEIYDLKKNLPMLKEHEINIIYRDNFVNSDMYLSDEQKIQKLLQKEKIFNTKYIRFGMRI